METKSLLSGIAGFILGGLVVSLAATTIERPEGNEIQQMPMSQMTENLREKSGDDYDKAFIQNMIAHHQSAVDMAGLSPDRAKHDEIKRLSDEIIAAQAKEINEMEQWRTEWGYGFEDESSAHGTQHQH